MIDARKKFAEFSEVVANGREEIIVPMKNPSQGFFKLRMR